MKKCIFPVVITACILFAAPSYAQNGVLNIIAGTGIGGYSGDGGPAVLAVLDTPQAVAVDDFGNVYIADGNCVIRKVNISGTITTIAGNGTAGYSGDGGAATAAQINIPTGIAVDNLGNVYIADYVNNRVRKVNTSGIITTIAGNGTSGYTGDGGPATAAQLYHPSEVILDNAGNIYLADYINNCIRKVNISGIITTIAGTGAMGYSGDGGAATAAQLSRPHGLAVDNLGNIFIADEGNNRIRKVNTAGVIITIAGNGIAGSVGDGIPATSAELIRPQYIAINKTGDIYIADWFASRVRKVNAADGKILSIAGNGSNSGYRGFALSSGFSIRGIAVDSFDNIFIVDHSNHQIKKITQTITCWFYLDSNNNCTFDNNEPFIFDPVTIAVDSNGIAVDTISATSSFGYNLEGIPGDIYTFKVVANPTGLIFSCPGSRIFSDTIHSVGDNSFTKYIPVTCGTMGSFDLAVNNVVSIVGPHHAWSNIYVSNYSCNATSATITANVSPKYTFGGSNITPSSISGNTITWYTTALNAKPTDIYCFLYPGISAIIGDTTQIKVNITPTTGDSDPTNNYMIIVDTIKASNDPNEMLVSPSGYIPSNTKLEYTIGFENTGNDTAFNIYIIDSLSDNVDPKSFRIITSSAKMNTTMLHSGVHNILKFDFPNINLLDSSHHGLCDGAVKFTINAKNDLPSGTTIFNHAGIYFDDNGVVMTNTVENIIGFPNKIVTIDKTPKIVIYPNPTTDELTIKMDKDAYSSYTITNSIGQVLLQQQLSTTVTQVSVKTLPPGLYYITLKGDSGNKVQKFVKM